MIELSSTSQRPLILSIPAAFVREIVNDMHGGGGCGSLQHKAAGEAG